MSVLLYQRDLINCWADMLLLNIDFFIGQRKVYNYYRPQILQEKSLEKISPPYRIFFCFLQLLKTKMFSV